ncbi:MAG: macro domain-containing protein [Blautia sp.]|nr:macro domain-containing protein [Blautia sp.]
MPFQIIRNDITKVKADAIVNTANPHPIIGSGTDSAIHKAAGLELLNARKKIGDIPPGSAVSTPAFNLPARYVIHTVGPSWVDGKHGEERVLRRAYDSALNLADQLGCRSVAFPLMAAGSYGFPRDLALSIAISAFTDFLMDHDMTVYLVLFNGKAFSLASSLFSDLKSYIDDNYVEEQTQKEYGSSSKQRWWQKSLASPKEYDLYKEGPSCGNASKAPRRPAASAKPLLAGSLKELLGQSESTFSEYLLDILKERSGKDSEVYKRAEISKQLFSKMLSNKYYQPTKNTVIQLAIGLQLDVNQTQRLLEKAGYTLTRSSKVDLVVQYYIERKVYNVKFINLALEDCGLPLLKTGMPRP